VGTTIEMATMEEKSLGTGAGLDHAPPLDGPHGDRRRRAHEVLSAQESYLERLEQTLTEQLEQLAREVAQSAARAEAAADDRDESAALAALQSQFETLKQQFATVDAECEQLRKQCEQSRVDLARTEQELRVRDSLLKEMQGREEQRRIELATLREQLADLQAQLNAARARQHAVEQEMAAERERFAAEQEETKAQRRRIAREFKQQRAERLAELEQRKAELERLAQARNVELVAKLEALQAELEQAKRQIAEANTATADPEALAELREQCELLEQKLAAAEARLAEQAAGGGEQDHRKRDDLQRRFEMAVEEVRELKRINADLENKLKSRGNAAGAANPSLGGGLNWEAQKQKLLASLEADSDDEDEEAREERINIEGTIRITDQIVAQKDREINELKQRLEQAGGGESNAAAVAELLDADEIIRQEREKLAAMQQEWRQKIGEAEIEISVQRAKLARERAELDDRIRQFQIEQESRSYNTEEPAEPGKPTRGKWLARLGLKDLDDNK
jgi:predicted  nucleic acid-binding Zn-ribbon protein